MPEYLVTWQIEIYADDPREAAEQALAIHRKPTSTATVFDVVETADGGCGHVTRVDLDEPATAPPNIRTPPMNENPERRGPGKG